MLPTNRAPNIGDVLKDEIDHEHLEESALTGAGISLQDLLADNVVIDDEFLDSLVQATGLTNSKEFFRRIHDAYLTDKNFRALLSTPALPSHNQ